MTDSPTRAHDPMSLSEHPEPDADADAILDSQDQPAAGGQADGEPAQGPGAPDSY